MIDLFCEVFVWKVCQKSSLNFFLSTSTHKRSPCQRISFFEVFFLFFDFFEKMVQMAGMAIHWKWSILPKSSKVLLCNHYLCILEWATMLPNWVFSNCFYKYHFSFSKCQKRLFLLSNVHKIWCKMAPIQFSIFFFIFKG